jgi:hypothetical protein
VNIVSKVIKRDGPNGVPKRPESRGKAERPDSREAERRPHGRDPGNADEGRPPSRPLTGRQLIMASALLEGNAVRGAGPVAVTVPGGLRAVVMECILLNDFRHGLQAVPEIGPTGVGDPFHFRGCGMVLYQPPHYASLGNKDAILVAQGTTFTRPRGLVGQRSGVSGRRSPFRRQGEVHRERCAVPVR